MIAAALAVPGDINTVTDGYIYDRRLLAELRAAGRDMQLVALPDSFPFPSPQEMAAQAARVSRKSDLGEAMTYMLRRQDGFRLSMQIHAGLARAMSLIRAAIAA
ncbi:MAG: hypothetical protein O2994_04905 [Proteobacteria bacterium]|nr:hypothetical protein [Pseudomonadota bacterium]MDA1155641.1 hypothetical protein [Pseudomonadota bacterium]